MDRMMIDGDVMMMVDDDKPVLRTEGRTHACPVPTGVSTSRR
jgi:hypothetical protein